MCGETKHVIEFRPRSLQIFYLLRLQTLWTKSLGISLEWQRGMNAEFTPLLARFINLERNSGVNEGMLCEI